MKRKTTATALVVGALGVVYGDLGTSPLYALNEVFFGGRGLQVSAEHAAGVASLIFWLLVLIVGLKYVTFVLRADNEGEGGVFALFGLLQKQGGNHIGPLLLLLMFSAGLLFGEGVITPAISVLSAVEGLKLVEPWLAAWVVPVTVLLLFFVFYFQKKGTARVGRVYGPVMLVWFIVLALLGVRQIVQYPAIIEKVLDPSTAMGLMLSLGASGSLALVGAAFLSLTGVEALYADMGHFGRRAIRVGWFFIVFPALALNYAGQAAFIMSGQAVLSQNIFYSLVPVFSLPAMIILSTIAAIIASVAMIFGIYSLVSQAMAMRLLPRFQVIHTNRETEGQIYLPAINWALFTGSALLVAVFGSSVRLAAAYGFAVSGVMLVTTLSMLVLALRHWKWPVWMAAAFFGVLLLLDLYFVVANSFKFLEGGYIPFFTGAAIFLAIAVWRWGWRIVMAAHEDYSVNRDIQWFLDLKRRVDSAGGVLSAERARNLVQSDRAAVFITSRAVKTLKCPIPVKLRLYLKCYGVVPRDVLFFSVEQVRAPYVKRHYHVIHFGQNVSSVQVYCGFMEDPNVEKILRELYRDHVIEEKFRRCAIEVSEDEFIIEPGLSWRKRWRALFFRALFRWSVPPYRFMGLTEGIGAGLSKVVVPVRIGPQGVRIETPEFPLVGRNDQIDPDTLQPDERRFIKI